MFSEFKLAFFDYDRTLVAHAYPVAGRRALTYEEECYIYLSDSAIKERHFWDKPLECMKWAIQHLKEHDAVLYVLTHEIFNLRSEMKSITAREVFGIENYIEVDSPEHKVDMIKAVAKFHGVPLRNCLFVDDMMSTVYAAATEGIYAVHTSDITAAYEEYVLSELRRLKGEEK